MPYPKLVLAATIGSLLTACAQTPAPTVTQADVVEHYAGIADAVYADALTAAEQLDVAIQQLLANPGEQTLIQARTAWNPIKPSFQAISRSRLSTSRCPAVTVSVTARRRSSRLS